MVPKIYSFIIKESLNSNEKVSKSAIIRAKENFGAFTDEGDDIVN